MQIHADSKGKVALDDITLWANGCTKCHGNTTVHVLMLFAENYQNSPCLLKLRLAEVGALFLTHGVAPI